MRAMFAVALLLAAGPGVGLAQPTEPHSLTVELSSFKFTPAVMTLRKGEPYHIRFVNTSGGGHDFVAKEFFAASTLSPEDAAKVHGGEIELSGGEAVEITATPNAAGTYKSHCSHFMHSSFGMKGRIVVQP